MILLLFNKKIRAPGNSGALIFLYLILPGLQSFLNRDMTDCPLHWEI